MSEEIEIIGLDKLFEKMAPEKLLGRAMRQVWEDATQLGDRQVRQYTPTDTGRLGSSWVRAISAEVVPLSASVGTIVTYAPFAEYDTRPHWPPLGALAGWAQRHGIPEFLVARAISQKGTKGRHMLEKAVTDLKGQMNNLIDYAAAIIEREWQA